jgi:allantoate deiminase
MISINSERLRTRLNELAQYGRDPEGGWTRFSFTDEYRRACEQVMVWMREAGMRASFDAAGNIIGRKEGTDPGAPAVAMGSHIDTVRHGGMFDGCFGVLGAIEIVQTISENGLSHRHPIEILVFSEEEGSRFGAGLLGSKALIGKIDRDFLRRHRDAEGRTIAEGFRDAGFDPDRIEEARKPVGHYKCYFEMHIEQGSVLEAHQEKIGIVEGISGYVWLEASIRGKADHAGATPMDLRSDALIPASRMVLEAEKIARQTGERTVVTVGRLQVSPNGINVVPGAVDLTFDIRDLSMEKVDQAAEAVKKAFHEICAERGVTGEIRETIRSEASLLSSDMVRLLERTAQKTCAPCRRMISGAAHDAQMMAKITDTAMLFVPSRNGVSHSPEEWSDIRDMAVCAQALLDAVTELF